jgi:glutathionylspermidine synthase
MERLEIVPRINWQSTVESLGFNFHTINNKVYWNESACYQFTSREIVELESATNEIQRLCMAVVDHVIKERRYQELHIPEQAWSLIEQSWRNREKSLYGRLDLSYSGSQPPKLLEYNADDPLCLLEASLVQKQWLAQLRPDHHQFNSIHERLVRAWSNLTEGPLHLACLTEWDEVLGNAAYLMDTAIAAGLSVKLMHMEKIGYTSEGFVDECDEAIRTLFKLYPWSWMNLEVYERLRRNPIRIIEPAWKMILSNKGMLVLLWELFPGHPNLLPAAFDAADLEGEYVRKPLLGREGQNIALHTHEGNLVSEGEYGEGPFMYQQLHWLPEYQGHFAVIGSWIIAGESAGIVVTEECSPITGGTSPAVPHFFVT